MSNDVSQVLNHNIKSSYSQSHVSPQGNPRRTSYVRNHDNKVYESNLRTNLSGHDSIRNKITCGCIPHGDSHPTGMHNMEDGTMISCSTGMPLERPTTTRESPDD